MILAGNSKYYITTLPFSHYMFKSYLAWPFTILQNDNITISWDFLRLAAPAAMLGHFGAVSLKKSHDIVILSICNTVKGQAKYLSMLLSTVILSALLWSDIWTTNSNYTLLRWLFDKRVNDLQHWGWPWSMIIKHESIIFSTYKEESLHFMKWLCIYQ